MGNKLKLVGLTVMLGAFSGLIIWCFMKAVSVCTKLIWGFIPETIHIPYITVLLCTAAGFIMGILHKRYGDYPEPAWVPRRDLPE